MFANALRRTSVRLKFCIVAAVLLTISDFTALDFSRVTVPSRIVGLRAMSTGSTLPHQISAAQDAQASGPKAAGVPDHRVTSDVTKIVTEADGSMVRKASTFRSFIEEGGEFAPEKGGRFMCKTSSETNAVFRSLSSLCVVWVS